MLKEIFHCLAKNQSKSEFSYEYMFITRITTSYENFIS